MPVKCTQNELYLMFNHYRAIRASGKWGGGARRSPGALYSKFSNRCYIFINKPQIWVLNNYILTWKTLKTTFHDTITVILHILLYCTFTLYFFLFLSIFMFILLCCVTYLHCPLRGPDLTYISLLIIFCIIEYVMNKKTLNLEPNILKITWIFGQWCFTSPQEQTRTHI